MSEQQLLCSERDLQDVLYALDVQEWYAVECPRVSLAAAIADWAACNGELLDEQVGLDAGLTRAQIAARNQAITTTLAEQYARGVALLERYHAVRTVVRVGRTPETGWLAQRAVSPIIELQAGYTATSPRRYAVALVPNRPAEEGGWAPDQQPEDEREPEGVDR